MNIGGWRVDIEDRDFLRSVSLPPITLYLQSKRYWQAPDAVDPRPWLQIEDQRQLGSCQGHALSTCCELAYCFEAGEPIQYSRMFAYIMSQRHDGIRGDQGSTISGGVKCAKQDGLCLEATWPYTGQYTTAVPQEAIDEAQGHRIVTAVQIRRYEDVHEFLASGVGGINIGIMWGLPNQPVIERYQSGGGGHAVSLVGYTERKDSQGRNYVILANSWGRGWGADGFAECSPTCIDGMLEHRFTEAYGLSDMLAIEPRKIEYKFLGPTA